jgi:Na+-driven multidrug efflux pump
VLVGQAVGANQDKLVARVARGTLALGAGYSAICLVVFAVLGGLIVDAMSAGDADLAARALALLHVSFLFLVADAANVIARGVLRGASDVRYAAIVGIITAWLTTPPLAWLLGVHAGLGVVGAGSASPSRSSPAPRSTGAASTGAAGSRPPPPPGARWPGRRCSGGCRGQWQTDCATPLSLA